MNPGSSSLPTDSGAANVDSYGRTALSFEGVQVSRGGQLVLNFPRFDVAAGIVTTIEGPNGSGKSTLLMAAAGLLDLGSGVIRLFGQPYHQGKAPAPRDLRRQVSLVFQDPWLPDCRVLRAVEYGLRLRGVPASDRQHEASRWLSSLHISELAGRSCARLSLGERRLVALASALVVRPRVLLLDETMAGLDQQHAALVETSVVPSLLAEKVTILIATHDASLAERLGSARVNLPYTQS